jgi:hypothetical protein
VLGPLPPKLVERSKLKYFSKVTGLPYRPLQRFIQGKLKWDEESSAGRHVRRKVKLYLSFAEIGLIFHRKWILSAYFEMQVKPLARYIPREERGNVDWQEMFDLIGFMLHYDPTRRLGLR